MTMNDLHCRAKNAPFYFSNNFVKTFHSEINVCWYTYIYSRKFGTKRHRNHQSLWKHVFTVLCKKNSACVRVFVTNVTLA